MRDIHDEYIYIFHRDVCSVRLYIPYESIQNLIVTYAKAKRARAILRSSESLDDYDSWMSQALNLCYT